MKDTSTKKDVSVDELTEHRPCPLHTTGTPDTEIDKSRNMEFKTPSVAASESTPSQVIPRQSSRELTNHTKDHEDVSQIRRESPDGSSDSSHYPATSPPVSYMSGSTMSESCPTPSGSSLKLLQATAVTNIPHSHTGARPKDFSVISRSDGQCSTSKGFLDAIDSGGGTVTGISPSLLQVNYGGDYSSEGDKTTSPKAPRPRVSQGSRTPQLRHRASSGRLANRATDSDLDSEDTGPHTQTSRRRRRPQSSQHHGVLSVKTLVDSRGVLSVVPDTADSKVFLKTPTATGECDCCHDSSESGSHGLDNTFSPPERVLQELSPPNSVTDEQNTGGQMHVMSTPISAAVPCEVDGIAFSAPERNSIKMNLTTTTPTSILTSKKKTHGRSRSDGSQDLVANKTGLPQSSTAPQLSASSKVLQNGLHPGRR